MKINDDDSNFERSNISFKENRPDGVDPNSKVSTVAFERNKGRTLRFSADCL